MIELSSKGRLLIPSNYNLFHYFLSDYLVSCAIITLFTFGSQNDHVVQ